MDNYYEQTQWIRDVAKGIAERTHKPYASILYIGLQAYREGDCDEEIIDHMLHSLLNTSTLAA